MTTGDGNAFLPRFSGLSHFRTTVTKFQNSCGPVSWSKTSMKNQGKCLWVAQGVCTLFFFRGATQCLLFSGLIGWCSACPVIQLSYIHNINRLNHMSILSAMNKLFTLTVVSYSSSIMSWTDLHVCNINLAYWWLGFISNILDSI